MQNPFRTYRILREGNNWRWEMLDDGQLVAYGYEPNAAKARAQAMIFALSVGTAEAGR